MTVTFWFEVSLFMNILLTASLSYAWWKLHKKGIPKKKDKGGIVYVVRENANSPVRYVGISSDLRRRIREHTKSAILSPVHDWLRTVILSGNQPIYDVIDTAPTRDELREKERQWIAHYRTEGQLLNQTDGG